MILDSWLTIFFFCFFASFSQAADQTRTRFPKLRGANECCYWHHMLWAAAAAQMILRVGVNNVHPRHHENTGLIGFIGLLLGTRSGRGHTLMRPAVLGCRLLLFFFVVVLFLSEVAKVKTNLSAPQHCIFLLLPHPGLGIGPISWVALSSRLIGMRQLLLHIISLV